MLASTFYLLNTQCYKVQYAGRQAFCILHFPFCTTIKPPFLVAVFDEKIVALLKLGEELNKLPIIFLQLKNQYTEDLRHKTGLLNSVLEPLLIVFIGGLVAVILIAMYLPMFSMQSVMN